MITDHGAVLLAFLAAGAAGCRKDDIEVRRVAKEAPPSMAMPAAKAAGLHWKTPAGWKELPGNGVRAATLRPPQAAGKIEGTVVSFPGDAGGELANVNRWRGQMTLPLIGESGLAAIRKKLRSPAGEISLYDFTSEDSVKTRMLVAMLKVGETTWFFKLTGAQKAVAAARPAFISMLEGLTGDEG